MDDIEDNDESDHEEQELPSASAGNHSGDGSQRKRLFTKELRCMLYGFGDDQVPYTETVDLLDDLLIQYITDMTIKAMSIGKKGRVHVEDIVFLIRKDPLKYARVKELLTMNEELKKARKAFDADSYHE